MYIYTYTIYIYTCTYICIYICELALNGGQSSRLPWNPGRLSEWEFLKLGLVVEEPLRGPDGASSCQLFFWPSPSGIVAQVSNKQSTTRGPGVCWTGSAKFESSMVQLCSFQQSLGPARALEFQIGHAVKWVIESRKGCLRSYSMPYRKHASGL